jgi:hypothetical protein
MREADRVTTGPLQLLVYRFGPDAKFEGRLVGILERVESGGALRVLEAFFLGSGPESGELVAMDLRGGRAGGIVAPLLDFRLDPAKRQRATERALDDTSGLPADTIRELGAALEPGAALVALIVEHAWARSLDDAVSRTGGARLDSQYVKATSLADLVPELLAAVARGEPSHGDP